MHEDATFDSLVSLLPEGSVTATWEKKKRRIEVLYKDGQRRSHWGNTPTFSEDGQFLATTSKSGTLQVWDMRTGELHHTEESFEELSWYCAASASNSDSLLSFALSNQWVSFAGAKIVQIPPNYSVCIWVAHGSTVVLGRESGEVIVISFQIDAESDTGRRSQTVRIC